MKSNFFGFGLSNPKAFHFTTHSDRVASYNDAEGTCLGRFRLYVKSATGNDRVAVYDLLLEAFLPSGNSQFWASHKERLILIVLKRLFRANLCARLENPVQLCS